MKFGKPVTVAVLAITGGLLLTACSGNSKDVADSGGNQPTVDAVAAVDLSALDTGDFPTEPRGTPFRTTAENINRVEAQRLAEYTVLPFEIDPQLTDTNGSWNSVIANGPGGGLDILFGGDEYPDELDKALYGFYTKAAKPEKSSEPTTFVSLVSLRFDDDVAAKAAADALYRSDITPDEHGYSSSPGRIDILPNTLVATTNEATQGSMWLGSLTVHNNFLIRTIVNAPPEQVEWITTTTAKLVTEQSRMLDRFPATDLNDPTKWPQVDQNKILKYTLGHQSGGGSQQFGVYGPRGLAHTATNPKLTFDLLTEVGAEHNANAGGIVFRAKTDEGATRIADGFLKDHPFTGGYTEVTIPRGLEGTPTKCLSHPLKPGTYCYTVVGRYAAESSALEKVDAQQRIAALYVILQQADQDAN